eukprot:TRINITY_DN2937_c0_g1_i1.p1 TRINITY_DN2937_c0_g1~~TRINITY_DN2937_c0_g1_i1.p1  ORF type:complete len:707 (+),score=172.75 TRINITY_DN2937_c0_g1_i1:59-2122(+)
MLSGASLPLRVLLWLFALYLGGYGVFLLRVQERQGLAPVPHHVRKHRERQEARQSLHEHAVRGQHSQHPHPPKTHPPPPKGHPPPPKGHPSQPKVLPPPPTPAPDRHDDDEATPAPRITAPHHRRRSPVPPHERNVAHTGRHKPAATPAPPQPSRWQPEQFASDGRPSTPYRVYERSSLKRLPQVKILSETKPEYEDKGWLDSCNDKHPAPHLKHGRTKGCGPHLNFTALCPPNSVPELLMYPRKQKRATIVVGRVVDTPRTIYRGHWGPHVHNTKPSKLIATVGNKTNAVLYSIEGSETPASVNPLPIADSHDGLHDIFRPWPTTRQVGEKVEGRVERGQWAIRFHRDPRNATRNPQLAEAQPAAWATVISDAWIFMGAAYTCGWGLTSGGCQMDIAVYEDAYWALDKAVIVCDGECNNYYHFTIEHLPRLALIYDRVMEDESLTILVPQLSKRAKFVRTFIVDVLGIDDRRLISADSRAPQWRTVQETVYVRRAFIPAPTICGRPLGYALLLMREIVFRRLGLPSVADAAPSQFRVVLAERGKYRMPSNWESVRADVLSRFSSDEVVFESVGNRSVEGQVRIFNSADLVIGPHGANMANIVWMRSGTTCLEFMPYHYGNMCYYSISSRLGLTHRFVLHGASKKGKYNVTADEVAKHITDAMLRPASRAHSRNTRRANGQTPLEFS